MKRVLLINSSVYLPGEGGYKRTMYLLDMMMDLGYDVKLLTSDFNHYSKSKRDVKKFRKNYPRYNESIVILPKKVYKKNISFKRYNSDKCFEKTIAKWVKKNIDSFDCIFASDLEAVTRINKIIKGKNVSLIIDIRDLFPEAIKIVLKNNLIYNILTFPFTIHANKGYKCADEIVAVSKEYLNRGLKVNKKSTNPQVVYIGSILDKFYDGIKKYEKSVKKNKGEFWLTYIGTIGSSYDFITIIDAMSQINEKVNNVKFKIIGQGPDEEMLKRYIDKKKIKNIDFLGFMDYDKMAAYLSKTDLTLNNIKRNASASIINKVADYFASGKPMLNSCMNEEMMWLIDNYQTGLNYEAENVSDFLEKFWILYKDESKRKIYGENAQTLAKKLFDRKESYKKIIEIIETTNKK